MKKRIVIAGLVIVLACGAGGGYWYYRQQGGNGGTSEDAVFVDSVGTITGLTGTGGVYSRFSGVVEAQRTEKIELTSGLKVKETYVSVGDEVKTGDKLFSYDTEDAQDSITQLEIDIENYDISIQSAEDQITQLEKERDKASSDEKLSYTTQIMTTENSIKRYEYEKKSKQAEMESLKKQIANAEVTSPLDGIVKTINSSASGDDDTSSSLTSDDSSSAYMTIMATGEYRIKGKINEQNMSEIQEGTEMIIYSRVDESLTWSGTISTIDKESASTSDSSSYYYYSDSSDTSLTSSSTYPFYVDLESSDGLMLGQHVYMEVDYGQADEQDGLWLDDYYFITDEDGAVTNYVWAADENDRLEKREVTLGNFDDELLKYEILDGLTVDDYIAFPGDDCVEGAAVTRNIDQVTEDIDLDEYTDDYGEYTDDEYTDDGYTDDEYIDDEYTDDEYTDDEYTDDEYTDDLDADTVDSLEYLYDGEELSVDSGDDSLEYSDDKEDVSYDDEDSSSGGDSYSVISTLNGAGN